MSEAAEMLGPFIPLIIAILGLLIPSAADRIRLKNKPPDPPVLQGQSVDFTGKWETEVRESAVWEAYGRELHQLLTEHDIPHRSPPGT